MDRLVRDLRVLLRAHGILAEMRLHDLLARNGLRLFAGLVAAFGLLMLNLTGYFALEPPLGRIFAAAAVALADFLVALALIGLAARLPRSRDLALAQELHGAALDAVLADAHIFEGFARHPFEALLPELIGPLAHLVLRSVKKPAPGSAP